MESRFKKIKKQLPTTETQLIALNETAVYLAMSYGSTTSHKDSKQSLAFSSFFLSRADRVFKLQRPFHVIYIIKSYRQAVSFMSGHNHCSIREHVS